VISQHSLKQFNKFCLFKRFEENVIKFQKINNFLLLWGGNPFCHVKIECMPFIKKIQRPFLMQIQSSLQEMQARSQWGLRATPLTPQN